MAQVKPTPYDDDPLAALIKQSMGPQQAVTGDEPLPVTGSDPMAGEVPPGITDPTRSPEVEPTKTELPSDPVVPAGPKTPTYNYGNTHGYDETKFNDPNKKSAKYVIGRTLSQFDPKQGITPEVLAALNALGFGNFSGQGDKLSLKGLTDAGKQAGLAGDYTDADFVEALNSGNGHWGYADPAYEAQHPEELTSGGGGAGGFGGPTLTLPENGVPSDTDFFQKLMDAAMKAQGGNMSRQSLLAQLGLK